MQDNAQPTCELLPGLSTGQSRLCQLYTDHMVAVASGARQALTECRHQFQNRRWNCSLLDDVNVFGPVLTIGKYLSNHIIKKSLVRLVFLTNSDSK